MRCARMASTPARRCGTERYTRAKSVRRTLRSTTAAPAVWRLAFIYSSESIRSAFVKKLSPIAPCEHRVPRDRIASRMKEIEAESDEWPRSFIAARTRFRASRSYGAVFILAFLTWAFATLDRSGYETRQGEVREQPVPFSHAHHVADDGIDCRYCHTTVETSNTANIPPTKTCMNCHSQIWNTAPMLEPVRESFRSGTRFPGRAYTTCRITSISITAFT
jgi:hypothetical protein